MISIKDTQDDSSFNDELKAKLVELLPEDNTGIAHTYEFTDNAEENPFEGYLIISSPTLMYQFIRTTKNDDGETEHNYMGQYVPTVDGGVMPENGLGQNLSDGVGDRVAEFETVLRSFHRKVLERLGQPVPGQTL
ncbi:hypothetical protein AH06_106 [Erwinia phage AH06]|nr:hypothetical protein AH06_106 [Erwinia phage AH06]